ncbi:hypothetical protein [Winogradskyella vidalii]|uniref:hypothetical protein n=1 Tax=Winogradskyella vidalii TaxID=2615024 RepID=UPI0015CE8FF1|nr:hypothetical protein [Winogradskyella vidalii]
MNLITTITNILLEEGVTTTYSEDDNCLIFSGVYKNETRIFSKDIVFKDHLIVWFQKDDYGNALLRSFKGNLNINYIPESNHSDYGDGIECLYLKIIDHSIIFVYREKHSDYICSIMNGIVKRERLYLGTKKIIKDNILYFKIPDYAEKNIGFIKKLKLPELEYDKDLSEIELNKLNIHLESNYFLYNRFK